MRAWQQLMSLESIDMVIETKDSVEQWVEAELEERGNVTIVLFIEPLLGRDSVDVLAPKML